MQYLYSFFFGKYADYLWFCLQRSHNRSIWLTCFIAIVDECRYVLYTAFSPTTAINEWSSVLYSVIYTSLPTIIVGILDKDLSRRTLLKYPPLYGAGHRQGCYNGRLFWLTMADTLWQSLVVFYVPYFAYRHSSVDGSAIGDLWTLAVVILVNLHLAMDVIRWTWITHAVIWGSIVATFICIIIIDAIPTLPGYWYVSSISCISLPSHYVALTHMQPIDMMTLKFSRNQNAFFISEIKMIIRFIL